MATKVCSRCKREKDTGEFNKNRTLPDGLSYYCRECSRKASKDYRKKNVGKIGDRKLREIDAEPPPVAVKEVIEANTIIEPDDKELIQQALRRNLEDRRHRTPEVVHATVDLGPDPVAIVFMSDWHIGGVDWDADALWNDCKTIVETPGMYCVVGGDLMDNFVHRALMAPSLMQEPPMKQWEWCAAFLRYLNDKILAIISGNHELWSFALTTHDRLKDIANQSHILYHRHGVFLTVRCGVHDTECGFRHKYKGNSQFNPAHPARKFLDKAIRDLDVIVLGHTHEYGMQEIIQRGKLRILLNAGAYQPMSEYSQAKGFQSTEPYSPSIVLMPNGDKLSCRTPTLAAELLNSLRHH